MNPSQDPHGQPAQSSHDEPQADEVRTPTWLTVTGIGLFVVAGLGWLMTRPPPPTIEQMREASTESSAAPASGPSGAIAQPAAPPKGSSPAPERPAPPALRNMPRPLAAPGKGP